MLVVSFRDTESSLSAEADIPAEHAPALRSAVAELRDTLGGRVEGAFSFKKEHALTRAVSSVGRMAAALNLVIPEGDRDYE